MINEKIDNAVNVLNVSSMQTTGIDKKNNDDVGYTKSASAMRKDTAEISEDGKKMLEDTTKAGKLEIKEIQVLEKVEKAELKETQELKTKDDEKNTLKEDVKNSNESDVDAKRKNVNQLSREDNAKVAELKARDAEVRKHEQAHQSASGGLAGSASFSYQSGPDGKRYAVGGEVSIDSGTEADPKSTISKMQSVANAALAPANPSAQDMQIASSAKSKMNVARAELRELDSGEENTVKENAMFSNQEIDNGKEDEEKEDEEKKGVSSIDSKAKEDTKFEFTSLTEDTAESTNVKNDFQFQNALNQNIFTDVMTKMQNANITNAMAGN